MQSKNLDHLPFTEKASKELKNISKGDLLEASFTRYYHRWNYPVLVSSKLLREYQLGQIDLCIYHKQTLYLIEVKSKPEGLNRKQYNRLKRSMEFLTYLFNAPGCIKLVKNLPKD